MLTIIILKFSGQRCANVKNVHNGRVRTLVHFRMRGFGASADGNGHRRESTELRRGFGQ